MESKVEYMSLTGVNRLCAQCVCACNQWQQVRVVNCPFFKSKQQKSAKLEKEDTLQAQQNAQESRREAIFGG